MRSQYFSISLIKLAALWPQKPRNDNSMLLFDSLFHSQNYNNDWNWGNGP